MILGTGLVLVALSLYVWNQREARQAERSVEEILPQLYQKLEDIQELRGQEEAQEQKKTQEQSRTQEKARTQERAKAQVQAQAQAGSEAEGPGPIYPGTCVPAMTEVEIDGYNYIGYLSVPALDLELQVMAEWDYRRLRIAPCRYAGSTKTDDLVIMAHNYERHFGKLSQLAAGDLVFFTDMDHLVSCYTVAEVLTLKPTAVEEMTAGEYALTLFTCTYGGKSRIAVRCDRAECKTRTE